MVYLLEIPLNSVALEQIQFVLNQGCDRLWFSAIQSVVAIEEFCLGPVVTELEFRQVVSSGLAHRPRWGESIQLLALIKFQNSLQFTRIKRAWSAERDERTFPYKYAPCVLNCSCSLFGGHQSTCFKWNIHFKDGHIDE